MKANFKQFGAAILAISAILFNPFAAQAQISAKLSFALGVTYQAPDVNSGATGNITKSSTKTAKFTSATLLNALQLTGKSLLSLNLGGGNSLTVGPVSSMDGSGNLTEQSNSITITATHVVVSGVSDSDKGTASQVYTAHISMSVDDGAGNSAVVSGVVKITDSIAAPSKSKPDAAPTETVSMSGTVSGSGSFLDGAGISQTAIYTGTIAASGKGPAGG